MVRPMLTLLTSCTLCTVSVHAGVPTYSTFEIQARTNIVDGYNLPPNSSANSATPDINDAGVISFRLIIVGGTGESGLFVGANGKGGVVFNAMNQYLISDPSINSAGNVAFEMFDFGFSDGVRVYDPDSGMSPVEVPTGGPFGVTGFASQQINDRGAIAFRGDTGAGDSYIVDNGGVQTRYAADSNVDAQSPYGFLFTPSFNNANQIAAKVRIGGTDNSLPDEIRVFEADGSSALRAVDDDGDPQSPYTGFDNAVALADDGRVAFIANLASGGRGVFLTDGKTAITIATTNDLEVSAISFFHPAVNSAGVVVFRGTDGAGLDAIFAGDGTTLRHVIGEHDIVPTDLGPARIDQHDSSVVFAGSPRMNANGDIVFMAALTPPDNNQIEWGTGAFIAYADIDDTIPGDIDNDGDVDFDDFTQLLASWGDPGCGGQLPCPADLDGDGDVDFDDFTTLLANWT